MVFLNYTTMQMTAKIVYYGPGLCGKTTNLQWIHLKTAPRSRGEMVSLETETDRTLFFDLLPLDVGVIGAMKVRLQLYTVPGQVFYNATRRLVLKGVDGIVFVADSQNAAMDTNLESLKNLRENLGELGLSIEQVPIVFQYNKRDIRNILPVDKLHEAMNPGGVPEFEAAAIHSVGVFETLKGISRLALAAIRRKLAEDNRRQEAAQPVGVASGRIPRGAPVPAPQTTPLVASAPLAPAAPVAPAAPMAPAASAAPAATAATAATAGDHLLAGLLADSPEVKEVEVEFAEEDTDKHAVRPVATRDLLDIHRELEKLRTLANTGRRKPSTPAHERDVERLFQDLMVSERDSRQEVKRKVSVDVPDGLLKGATDLRVHLAFERDGKEEMVEDAVTIKLIGNRRLERLILHLDLDLKGKG
jgi:signal recognition particle receptor subunit beta